jgi:hypothetical protein
MEGIAKGEMRYARRLSELIIDLGGIRPMLRKEPDFGTGAQNVA